MARYEKTVAQLAAKTRNFVTRLKLTNNDVAELAYIINLAVRSHPRPTQSTVRRKIVEGAVGDWCKIAMTKELDERTGKEFNKIQIAPKGGGAILTEEGGEDNG